ncbi:MAG: 2,5-diamino-6-(ribosylamino)-4(3H)-pyrimidinone 5'-phosphate reductase [Anaerolineales bacterium]|nr:2,5-diamino-6-(ribosylamino)-4(3H)-pyrimidinone 5'-phosphate reductase [Anaerolineales bacterium]
MTRPYVHVNIAMTADGKIDTFERRGAAISSPRDKERVDKLRAEADAVMVGGRTLLDENPKLTVKSAQLRAEREARGLTLNPVKVGVASNADLRPDSDFLNVGPARIVIFTTQSTSKEQLEFLRARGVDVFVHDTERVDLFKALHTLTEIGIDRLMVEGGGTLNFELLRLGLVDELTAYVAPLVFGGESAPTLAAGSGLVRSAAIPLKLVEAEVWEDGGVLLHYKLSSNGG